MPRRPEEGITYVGCKEAKEISLTRAGANPMAHALVRKSIAGTPAPASTPETPDMDSKAITKAVTAVAAMNDVTKAHFLALDDDAKAAFIEKSVEDQKTEAEAAKAKVDEAAAAEARKAEGLTDKEKATEKSISDLKSEIDTLKAEKADRSLRDVAKSADFDGYPGGEDKVYDALKAMSALPEAAQNTLKDALKATAANAKRLGGLAIGNTDNVDVMKSKPATAKIEKAAKERAVEKKITYHEAFAEMAQDNTWAEDFAAMRAEEMGAAA